MTGKRVDEGVALAAGNSASTVLHAVLSEAARAFPEALDNVGFPVEADVFRRCYDEVLPRFEANRLGSPQRLEIARHALTELQRYLVLNGSDGVAPLHEALGTPMPPLELQHHTFPGVPGWRPGMVYQGERWGAERLAQLGELLVERMVITPAAGAALNWLAAEALRDGALDLRGRRIAVLGGGAEMAPTRLWLEAGADVLWLDVAEPPQDWFGASNLAGRLYWPVAGADLLRQPREALATLIEFADGRPLDLGLYAYAPGAMRELRLTAAMNALVEALPAELVATVTMLVSPTTPTQLSEQDLGLMQAREAARPLWETVCARLGLLGRGGGSVASAQAAVTRTVVTIQGASYQAAQYLGKILTAECWASDGPIGGSGIAPLRVSANTAAITRTRSLDHPVFSAAFGGAAALGVETMAPRQSRQLNGLLAVHDWLNPALPEPGAIRVHGGIHTLPYPLGSALRVAAAIGFARSPRLLRGLLGRR